MFCKKCVLKNFAKFTGKYLRPVTLLKKETLVQVLSFEFSEISVKQFKVTASVKYEYTVNARFTQGLLQLLFTFFG